jgi:hypothetical protein
MSRWLAEWLVVSALAMLSMGLLCVFWVIWPLLAARVIGWGTTSLDMEGLAAMGLLLVVGIGFLKLMTRR